MSTCVKRATRPSAAACVWATTMGYLFPPAWLTPSSGFSSQWERNECVTAPYSDAPHVGPWLVPDIGVLLIGVVGDGLMLLPMIFPPSSGCISMDDEWCGSTTAQP